MDSVLDFIQRRFTEDCHWLDGNCYYFALILADRFPELDLVYFPVTGHFVAADLTTWVYYDFEGKHNMSGVPYYKYYELYDIDPEYFGRIQRDCVL